MEDITAVLQDSLNEKYLIHSRCYDLCDFHQTLNAPEFQPEEQLVWCFLDMDGEDTPEK